MAELIAVFIVIAVVVWLVYLLVVYVIAPIVGILLTTTLVISIGYAFITSIRSFIKSLIEHKNPYTTYVDKSPNAQSGIKRNYFFGPGYHQITITIKDAFDFQSSHLSTLKSWRQRYTGNMWYIDVWIWIFYYVAFFCTVVLGFAWMFIFSLLLSVILFTGMCGFYIFFTTLWGADRLLLLFRSISSRCLNCKKTAIVPFFECNSCGMKHRKLTPGPYGILTRKCACGIKLRTTFFNGRSRLQASCPYCKVEMAASDSHQFGIQLVGGTSAGKTTFLASFWHQYLKAASVVPNLKTERIPEDAFDELEYWFNRGLSVSTAEENANMYSVIHHLPNRTPLQFAFYDIAGEAFMRLDENIQQQQFQYCEGIIFVVDPTAPIGLTEDVLVGFLSAFKALKGKVSSKLSALPVAIIISKSDLFKKEIGLVKIKTQHRKNSSIYADEQTNTSYSYTRNEICRMFLNNHGFSNVVNLLDSEFKTIAFFPVSAIGHEASEGNPYEP